MKKIFFCSIGLIALSLNAFANSTVICHNFPGIGYEVRFLTASDNSTTATVRFAKTGDLNHLNCSTIDKDPTLADGAQPILGCVEKHMNDSGYNVVLTDEDFSGKQYAILSEVSFVGTKELAKVPCQISSQNQD